MSNLLVPTRPSALGMTRDERAVLKHAKALHRRALEVRSEDAARRYVATGRTHDIKRLTKDALEAAGEIGDRLAFEAQARPFLARELEDIASTGLRGLKAELAFFIEEGH